MAVDASFLNMMAHRLPPNGIGGGSPAGLEVAVAASGIGGGSEIGSSSGLG